MGLEVPCRKLAFSPSFMTDPKGKEERNIHGGFSPLALEYKFLIWVSKIPLSFRELAEFLQFLVKFLVFCEDMIFSGGRTIACIRFLKGSASKQVKNLSHGERSLSVITGSIYTQLIHVQAFIQGLGQEVMRNRLQTEEGASF